MTGSNVLFSIHPDPAQEGGVRRSVAEAVEELNGQTSLVANRRVVEGRPLRLAPTLWRMADRFLRTYWHAQNRQERWRRLWVATCAGFFPWLVFMKCWERSLPKSEPQTSTGADENQQACPTSNTDRERLTVLLITKNEEQRITRCLASVAWADQIVVVDGQSTDRTVELCRDAAATVISRPFSGSFAEERNAGLDVATGDWVLQMDADEIVTPGLRDAIERVLTSRERRFQAYQVHRRNLFIGHFMRYGGWYHDHLCLFRRTGRRYHGLVHERLNLNGEIGRLDADLQHEPFQSIEQFVTRQNRYTTLQARELLSTRGRLPWRTVHRTLWLLPLNRWWKFCIKKRGYRDGMHGLVFSILYAWVNLLVWVKYAELTSAPDGCVDKAHR